LTRKRVLDAGCGVGHHTPFYLARGCTVVGIDGRPENIERMKELYPEVQGLVGDVQDMDPGRLGTFDIVHCLGLLSHLDSPIAALSRLASVCGGVLIIETKVCDARRPVLMLADDRGSGSAPLGGVGYRPSPSFVAMALDRVGFPHVYGTTDPPRHADFRFAWLDTLDVVHDGHDLRCMFVASRNPIHAPHLVELIGTD
jgi:SAM-dependent methyltransferase